MRYGYKLKVVCNSNAINVLSNSANISSWSISCPFCVCTEKKSSVHAKPWLCKWETNRVTQTEPPTCSHSQVVKYQRFVTTRARAQDSTNAVHYSRKFEGALKGLFL